MWIEWIVTNIWWNSHASSTFRNKFAEEKWWPALSAMRRSWSEFCLIIVRGRCHDSGRSMLISYIWKRVVPQNQQIQSLKKCPYKMSKGLPVLNTSVLTGRPYVDQPKSVDFSCVFNQFLRLQFKYCLHRQHFTRVYAVMFFVLTVASAADV